MSLTLEGKKIGKIYLEGKKIGKIFSEGRKIYDSMTSKDDGSWGEMILHINTTELNTDINLEPYIVADDGDGNTDIEIDWGDDSPTERFNVPEDTYTDDLPITAYAMVHRFVTPGDYQIHVRGYFKWGTYLGAQMYGDLLTETLTEISLPNAKSPLKNIGAESFANFRRLEQIAEELFHRCYHVQSAYQLFQCTGLTSIPEKLFYTFKNVTNFYKCFLFCNRLTSIPYTLFQYCSGKLNLFCCFQSCSNLIKLPEWWTLYPDSDHTECFIECYRASNYDEALANGWV